MFHCPFVNVHGLKFLHISVIGLWRSVSPPAFDRVNVTESDAAASAPNGFVPHPNLPSVLETSKTTKIFFPSLFPDHTAKYQVGSLSRDHARAARDKFMFCVSQPH